MDPEELRTVVDEAGDLIPEQYQNMLLNILDLGKAMVKDIMIPATAFNGGEVFIPGPFRIAQNLTKSFPFLVV